MDSYVLFVPESKVTKQKRSPACAQCRRRKIGCDRGRPMCSNCIRLRRPQCSYPDGSVGYPSPSLATTTATDVTGTSFNDLDHSDGYFLKDGSTTLKDTSSNFELSNDYESVASTVYDPDLVQQPLTLTNNGLSNGVSQTVSNPISPDIVQMSLPTNLLPAAAFDLNNVHPRSTASAQQLQLPTSYQSPTLTDMTTKSLAESALRTLLNSSSDHKSHAGANNKPRAQKLDTPHSIQSTKETKHNSSPSYHYNHHHHHNNKHHHHPSSSSRTRTLRTDSITDIDTSQLLSEKDKINSLSLEDIANYNTKLRIMKFYVSKDKNNQVKRRFKEVNDDNDNNTNSNNNNKKSKKINDSRIRGDSSEKSQYEALSREMILLKRRLIVLERKLASLNGSFLCNDDDDDINNDTDTDSDDNEFNDQLNHLKNEKKVSPFKKERSELLNEKRRYIDELLSEVPFKIPTLDIQNSDTFQGAKVNVDFRHSMLFAPESLFDKDPFIMKFFTSDSFKKSGSEGNYDNDQINQPFFDEDRVVLIFNWKKSALRKCFNYLFTKLGELVEYLYPVAEKEMLDSYIDELYDGTNDEKFSIPLDPLDVPSDLCVRLSRCGVTILMALLTYFIASDCSTSIPSFVSELDPDLNTVSQNLYLIEDILRSVRDPIILSQKILRTQLVQFFVLWKFYELCGFTYCGRLSNGNKIDLAEDINMAKFESYHSTTDIQGTLVTVAQREYIYRTLAIGEATSLVDPHDIIDTLSPRSRELVDLVGKLLTYFQRQPGLGHQPQGCSNNTKPIPIKRIASLLRQLKAKFWEQAPFIRKNKVNSKMELLIYFSCSIFSHYFILLNLELESSTSIVYSYVLLLFLNEIKSFLSIAEELLSRSNSSFGFPNYNILSLKRVGRLLESVSLMLYALYRRSSIQGMESTESYTEKVKFHSGLKKIINNIHKMLQRYDSSTTHRKGILSGVTSRLKTIIEMIEEEENNGSNDIPPNAFVANFFRLTEGKLGECASILQDVWTE